MTVNASSSSRKRINDLFPLIKDYTHCDEERVELYHVNKVVLKSRHDIGLENDVLDMFLKAELVKEHLDKNTEVDGERADEYIVRMRDILLRHACGELPVCERDHEEQEVEQFHDAKRRHTDTSTNIEKSNKKRSVLTRY